MCVDLGSTRLSGNIGSDGLPLRVFTVGQVKETASWGAIRRPRSARLNPSPKACTVRSGPQLRAKDPLEKDGEKDRVVPGDRSCGGAGVW